MIAINLPITTFCRWLSADLAAHPVNPNGILLARDRFARADCQAVVAQDPAGRVKDYLRVVIVFIDAIDAISRIWLRVWCRYLDWKK